MNFLTHIVIIGFLLSGCSSSSNKIAAKEAGPSERTLVNQWQGKNSQELVARYGEPDMLIDTTLRGRLPSEGYVYGAERQAGNSKCINVYVVSVAYKTIEDYFCR